METDIRVNWKVGEYVVDLAYHDVFDQWCSIGLKAGLKSDAQIATFLIKQYEKTLCAQCKAPLSMYCSLCCPPSTRPPSPFDTGAQAGRSESGHPRCNTGAVAGDVQQMKVELTQPGPVNTVPDQNVTAEGLENTMSADDSLVYVSGVTENRTTGKYAVKKENGDDMECDSSVKVNRVKEEITGEHLLGKENSMTPTDSVVTSRTPNVVKPPSPEMAIAPLPSSVDAYLKEIISKVVRPDSSVVDVAVSKCSEPVTSTLLNMHSISKTSRKLTVKRKSTNSSKEIDNTDNRLMCKVCGDNFDSMCGYRKHMKIHGVDKPFECNKCNEKFSSKGNIRRHTCLRKNGSNESSRPFVCNQCGHAFALKCNLRRHLEMHAGIRPKYFCEICKASFTEKQSYLVHKNTHSDERPFQCSVCGATFKMRSCLNKHSKKHKDDKPYMCTECGFSFKLRDYLRQHMRIHTGERPFVCEVCGVGFAQKGSLNSHRKTHRTDT